MSVKKYTENLPAEAAFAVRALLTVPKEAQDKWAEDIRTRFTQYCSAVKGEGSNEMNWTKEQWMTPLPEMVHFFQQFFVLSAKADLGIWADDEVRAWKQFSERVPTFPFTEEDEVAARKEIERNYGGVYQWEGYSVRVYWSLFIKDYSSILALWGSCSGVESSINFLG